MNNSEGLLTSHHIRTANKVTMVTNINLQHLTNHQGRTIAGNCSIIKISTIFFFKYLVTRVHPVHMYVHSAMTFTNITTTITDYYSPISTTLHKVPQRRVEGEEEAAYRCQRLLLGWEGVHDVVLQQTRP